MYSQDDDHDNLSDYEDAVTELFGPNFKPSYVVVAIDSHRLMFLKNEKGVIPFRMAIEALTEVADELLFRKDSRTWSPFAVVIAGKSTPFINFGTSVVESLKLLKATSLRSDDDLSTEFQRKGELNLSSFFLDCKKIFQDIKSVFYSRKLIYVSNDDKPVNNNNKKFTALNEIKSYAGSQIEFQIIPTLPSFNYKLFYNELFSLTKGPRHDEICTDTEGLTQKLSSVILVNINQRNVLFYPFKGDTSRYIKCLRLYIYSHMRLYSSFMTKDGKRLINDPQPPEVPLTYYVKFVGNKKGDHVHFDALEKEQLNDFTTPKGLTLSFIGDRQIGIGHIFTMPCLIKPDPKENSPYFYKFWDNCVASNKVLVCISKVRQPDRIRYAELIPVLIDGVQMFLEKRLPFGNEIVPPQKITYPEEETNDARKQAVQELVDKLTFEYDPKLFPDIAFQKKKAYVKAKLLNETPETVNDTELDNQTLDSLLEEVVSNIKSKFDLSDAENKRKGPAYYGHRAKRFK